ncbi:hypothetical protein SAMN04487835_1466 [Sharpea azabuensis]|nr:hypothetical protein [Sharpea azabuensis]SFE39698.1 hypothetical protein SAMN04487836_14510 [Sharpea azabuensis]SFL18346.1 hypothetical protein SAMN04487835_1466 [Sharpea azabuensis]
MKVNVDLIGEISWMKEKGEALENGLSEKDIITYIHVFFYYLRLNTR